MEPLNEIVAAPVHIANRVTARVAEEIAVLPIRAVEASATVAARGALKLTGYAAKSVLKMGVEHAKRGMYAKMQEQQSRGMTR